MHPPTNIRGHRQKWPIRKHPNSVVSLVFTPSSALNQVVETHLNALQGRKPYANIDESRFGQSGKGLRKEMVGTTRFELATSPTPRVRSTRLSHVPTCLSVCPGGHTVGFYRRPQVYTRLFPSPTARSEISVPAQRTPLAGRRPRQRRTHSSARQEIPALLVSKAAVCTR